MRGPCPPDGYRWVCPEDGWTSHAWDYQTWVDQAVAHLQANQRIVPSDLGEQMQEQLCKTLPPGWCQYDDPNRPRPSTTIYWEDVANGGKILANWLKQVMRTVEKSEAERRALICSRCYLNVNVQGCGACHAAVDLLTKNLSTKYDFALKSCAACKCLLRAKVHCPNDVLDKESDFVQSMYPDFCWRKKGGENYGG